MAGAVNYLYDVTFTIQGTTGGDDGNPTRTLAGSPLTIEVDEVEIEMGDELRDHSAGQSRVPLMRGGKGIQRATFNSILEATANNALSKLIGTTGEVIAFTATSIGGNFEGYARLGTKNVTFNAPSKFRWNLESYGTFWDVTTGS